MSFEHPSAEIKRGHQFSPTLENGVYSIHRREIVSIDRSDFETMIDSMDENQIVFYGDPVHGWLTAERADLLEDHLDSLVPEADRTIWIFKE